MDISYANNDSIRNNGKKVTMREFYAYRLQCRKNEGKTLLRGGCVLHQYIVDAFTCMGQSRAFWIRRNKKKLRSEVHEGLVDSIT